MPRSAARVAALVALHAKAPMNFCLAISVVGLWGRNELFPLLRVSTQVERSLATVLPWIVFRVTGTGMRKGTPLKRYFEKICEFGRSGFGTRNVFNQRLENLAHLNKLQKVSRGKPPVMSSPMYRQSA